MSVKRIELHCGCTEDVSVELRCGLRAVQCMGCCMYRILTIEERQRVKRVVSG